MAKMALRKDIQEYFMGIAFAVRKKANCKGRKIGAVLVLNERIIASGYNGTPEGMPNCLDEDGCYRCVEREKGEKGKYKPGEAYDVCICVHAEQNALLSAARFGISVNGATIFTTLQPCFGCMKELLQAKIDSVYYLKDMPTYEDPDLQKQYTEVNRAMDNREGVWKVDMPDPEPEWAAGKGPATPMDTGHA